MKKILIIINNFGVGGAERLVIDDANELLRRKNIDFKIITLKNEGRNSLSEQLEKQVDWTCINFRTLYDFNAWLLLYNNIKNFNPDVLFTHLWFSNTLGRIVGKLAGVSKTITFEHNVYDNLKTKKMFFIDWILQPISYKIIAVSETVKKSLISYGIKENKIKVILNGIDMSKYQNTVVTELNGEKKKDFTFIFVGRLIHQKGVDILLRAFASVKKGRMLIVGDGTDRENLVRLAAELKINDSVEFLGIRKDIPDILSYADCFVIPSRYEGLGIVFIEAMASRVPIIASDFEAGRNILINECTAMIFENENVEELSKLMSSIMYGRINTGKIVDNAILMSAGFSISRHVDKLLSLS